VDVQALVEGAVTKALAQFQAKLEGEPPLKTPGYAVPSVQVRQDKMSDELAFKLWMKWGNEAPPEVLKAMRRKFQRLTGLDIVDGEMKATLAEGTNAQGGYWVPTIFSSAIETPLANQSYLRRAGANVMAGIQGTDSFRVGSLTFSGRATIGGEGSAYVPDEPSAGEIEFNPYKLKKLALATEEMVEDSRYDVWTMILQPDFEQAFAEGENYYFTNGTGSGMPQGVVYGATVGVTAASTTVPTFDEIKGLVYSVDYKYREDTSCAFMMNDATALVVDKLKDGEGNYIWRESQQAGLPPRLLGFPVYFNQQMSAPATGVDAILFGAFRYYSIAPWPGLQIQRLVEKYADTGHIGFRAFRRVDGNIMQAAAFRKLRMA
jgi:HK97 family phage major capsid protein